ncbi:transcriptional regulator family: Fungal Specific TF [Purpureocillium lilacinum]|uniref:protein-serine/threonine phosphatase n=1 Tax=Purpureocillium lilacinum TaxID=33203 RepID=A0ABR0BS37_PURLI|nr:transcriptional regulator family: Fungal Specific TF [Purpureocillium lilacinum]
MDQRQTVPSRGGAAPSRSGQRVSNAYDNTAIRTPAKGSVTLIPFIEDAAIAGRGKSDAQAPIPASAVLAEANSNPPRLRYLRQLQRQAAYHEPLAPIERSTSIDESVHESPPSPEDDIGQARQSQEERPFSLRRPFIQTPISIESANSVHPEAPNPLASTSTAYVSDDSGRLRCLGESSTWSFTQKTLMLIHDHLHGQGLPVMDIATNEESRAYPLSWGSSGFDDPANFTDLPSADHALYLINGLKFHVGQLYHLYDESHFMKPFHDFYSAPAEVARENRIWYVQFLTLLGLAKALVVQPSRQGAVLPGTDLFLRAMSLLPDTPYLFSDALTSVETLCAISIYLQCADLRNSAYIHVSVQPSILTHLLSTPLLLKDISLTTSEIGTALRVAVTFGLHRERPTQDWGPSITERCQRVWWTVYVLDRTFSSSMGVPISIQDADITTTMPSRDGARDSMTLYVHVKLSNLISEVVNKVYGAEGRLRSSFLPCVHKVLERIASIASDLNACFPLSYDGSDGGISRVSSHLHLFYHQTILLTMYPLLLYIFQTRLRNRQSGPETARQFSDTTRALLKSCKESCRNMIGILTILQQQGLLGGALPFDLERTFSSGFVSTMLTFIDPHDGTYRSFHDQTCHLLDEFVDRGCTPARFRKSEVELLRDMIRQCDAAAEGDTMIRGSTRVGQRPESQHQAPSQERLGDVTEESDDQLVIVASGARAVHARAVAQKSTAPVCRPPGAVVRAPGIGIETGPDWAAGAHNGIASCAVISGGPRGGSQGKGPVVTWVQAGTCDAGLLGRRRQAKAQPAEKYRYYPASRAPPQQNPILLPSSPHPRPGRRAGGHPLLATGWAASGQGSSLAAAAAATPGIGAGGGAHAVVAGGSGGVVPCLPAPARPPAPLGALALSFSGRVRVVPPLSLLQNLAAPDTRSSLTHPRRPPTRPPPTPDHSLSHHHDTTPPPAPPSPAHNLNPCTRLAEPTIHAFFSTTTRRWIPPSAFFPSRLRHPPPSLVLPAHPRGSSPQLPTRQDLPPWAKPSRSPLSKRCVHALPRAPACAGSSLADYATAPDRASPPRPACLPACLPACPPRSLVQASSRPLSPFLSFPTTPGDEGLRVMARRTALARSPRPSARIARPLLERTSDKGEDDRLIYGLSAMQGWRISMEDSHTAVLDLGNPNSTDPKKHPDHLSFFGVFDGHGGDKVALFAGENIHKIIAKQDSFKNGDYSRGLQDGFLATDRAILNDPKYEEEVSGCTACVSLIAGNKLYVANAGDSRGVLGIKGRAKPMSQDHKPQLEAEKNRITAAGGFVDFGRVNGNLALSRAIGDFEFKKSADLSPENQIVTAFPDVDSHDLTDEDEFLVLACDGIWDCQSSQAVVEFVRRGIAAKQDLDKICENMMDNCLASNSETGGVGCDNMTMVIIGFLHGKTKEEWYEEIARRVANGDGPCAPPEYAEFRGPGVHHNYEDSDSGYEMDAENKGKSFGVGGYRGRIIFLGDGTEVLTDSDDTEMFDNTDEDKDLESQVSKNASTDGSSAPQPASEASATETKPETEAAKPSESETAPSKQEKSESEDKKD